jgi:hypothetical protein
MVYVSSVGGDCAGATGMAPATRMMPHNGSQGHIGGGLRTMKRSGIDIPLHL